VLCCASRVVPGAHRVVGPGTHRGSGPREVHTTVFILLESLSPSRRIFIGSQSLPLSGSPFRSFTIMEPSHELFFQTMEFHLSQSLLMNFSFRQWIFGYHWSFSWTFLSYDGISAITEPSYELFFYTMEFRLSRSRFMKSRLLWSLSQTFTNSFLWWNTGYHEAFCFHTMKFRLSRSLSRSFLSHDGISQETHLGEDSFHVYYKDYLHRIRLVKNLASWFRAPFARKRVRSSLFYVKCEIQMFLFLKPLIDPWFSFFTFSPKLKLAKENSEIKSN
jgi:hypothetical protein